MDLSPEELASLGFGGVVRESFKTIRSSNGVSRRIAFFLIFPVIFFLPMFCLFAFSAADGHSSHVDGSRSLSHADDMLILTGFQQTVSLLIRFASIFYTVATTNLVARVYANASITFDKVKTGMGKTSLKIFITFIFYFVLISFYSFIVEITVLLVILWVPYTNVRTVVSIIITVFFFIGYVYIEALYQISCAVTVVEGLSGIRALCKARQLLTGKVRTAFWIVVVSSLSLLVLLLGMSSLLLVGRGKLWGCIMILYLLAVPAMLVFAELFTCTWAAVLYFACKAYHNEYVDKAALHYDLDGWY